MKKYERSITPTPRKICLNPVATSPEVRADFRRIAQTEYEAAAEQYKDAALCQFVAPSDRSQADLEIAEVRLREALILLDTI